MSSEIYNSPNAPRDLAFNSESALSAVSWAAIVAGGVGAAAMAMVLVTLGAGFGLLAVSPWDNEGASATTLGVGVILWSIVVHAASFGLGGYLAGRLRTKWANVRGDEVYFRDTAHGFITWALGSLVSVCIMTSLAGDLARGTAATAAGLGGAGAAAGAMTAGQMSGMAGLDGMGRGGMTPYFSDMLLRPMAAAPADASAATQVPATTPAPAMALSAPNGPGDGMQIRGEAGRILTTSLSKGEISPADKTYLAQLISQKTGMSQQDAEKRVDDVIGQAKAAADNAKQKAKQVADDARKAAAGAALWAFVAMLVGAFCASYAATIGGRNRDL